MEYLSFKIQELRRKNHYSQEDLAGKIGVSRQAISKWERNEGLPDLYNIKKLAEVFNVSVDDLLEEKTEIQKDINQIPLILISIPTVIFALLFLFSFYQAFISSLSLVLFMFNTSDLLYFEYLIPSIGILVLGLILISFVELYKGNQKFNFRVLNIIIYSCLIIGYLLLLTNNSLEGFSMIFLYLLGLLILVSGLVGNIIYKKDNVHLLSKKLKKGYLLTKRISLWLIVAHVVIGALSLFVSNVLLENVEYCNGYVGETIGEEVYLEFSHTNENSRYNRFYFDFEYTLDDLDASEGLPYIEVYLDEDLIVTGTMLETESGYYFGFSDNDYKLPIYQATTYDSGIIGFIKIEINYSSLDGETNTIKSYYLNEIESNKTNRTFWFWQLNS